MSDPDDVAGSRKRRRASITCSRGSRSTFSNTCRDNGPTDPTDLLRVKIKNLLGDRPNPLLDELIFQEAVELLCTSEYRDRWVLFDELRFAITLAHLQLGDPMDIDPSTFSRALVGERRKKGLLKQCLGIEVNEMQPNVFQLYVQSDRLQRIDDRVVIHSIYAGDLREGKSGEENTAAILDPRNEEDVHRHKRLRTNLGNPLTVASVSALSFSTRFCVRDAAKASASNAAATKA